MEKQLRAVALGLIAIAAASAANIGTAHAQAVYCTNCSSEFTQLMNLARLIDQLGTQGNILKTNINQFRNMTVNTTPFSSLQWGNAAGELQSVNSILAGANTLSFANPAPNGQSGKQYGTYDSYLASPATSEASDVKYQQWSSDIDSSVLSSLKAGNLQSRQMTASEQNAIDRLKSQTGSVQGQLQALQTIAQVGILNAGQLQKLRQLILIDTSLHANRIQAESDRTAYHQAAWKNFLKRPANVPTTGGARF